MCKPAPTTSASCRAAASSSASLWRSPPNEMSHPAQRIVVHGIRDGQRAILRGLLIASVGCAAAGGASAAETPAAWSGNTPAAYAQLLVEQTLARHPDLRILAFHVAPPDRAENMIVAS